MFKFTRQHSSVELVELHQLNQVGEFGGAVIKAEEDLAVLFTLSKVPGQSEQNAWGGERKEKKKIRLHVWVSQQLIFLLLLIILQTILLLFFLLSQTNFT